MEPHIVRHCKKYTCSVLTVKHTLSIRWAAKIGIGASVPVKRRRGLPRSPAGLMGIQTAQLKLLVCRHYFSRCQNP